MQWSFRVARVAGIDIKVHVTFVLIVVLGALQWSGRNGLSGALFGALLILALFVCVTLHELGHSLVAQRFGIPVRSIILLPLGGIAFLERNPTKPLHELLIAIAGPLVNVVIAAVLYGALGGLSNLTMLSAQGLVQGGTSDPSLGTFLLWLLQANVSLVLFNLIPAFPLDGGRVFRAALWFVLNFRRATGIAVAVGQLFALGLGVLGVLSGNFLLVLVAVFIFFGAGQENAEAQARTMLTTQRVGDAYNKHALTLTTSDHVGKVIDYILTSYQPDFAVLQGTRLLGVVSREDVLRALASAADESAVPDMAVTTIMRSDVVGVDADATLDDVRRVMGERGARLLAVHDGATYLGLVGIEDLTEAYTVLQAVERYRTRRGDLVPAT